jgi:CubicO group peptidase (beta-lactamase class C family)
MSEASSPVSPIDGDCEPRFESVREALRRNFQEGSEWGCSVCVIVEGHVVVDLWGGFVDADAQRPWQRDTLVNAYSVGKGILAILALRCVEAGLLDLDATVDSIWPGFGTAGKDGLTVRGMLAHRAGLPGVRELLPPDAMYDWTLMCDALAAQEPFWEPGAAHGYHVNTQGFLVGELIRRVSGRGVGALLREWITGPIGADFYFGLPRSEHSRVSQAFVPQATLTTPEQWAKAFPPTGDAEHDTMIWRAYFNPSGISGLGTVNTAPWREAVIPSTNGHGNARGVAAVFAAYLAGKANGEVWAGESLRREAATVHSDGDDIVLGRPSRFGLGFQLPLPSRPLGPNAGAHGHYGYGGSLALADPEASLAFAYLTNRPGDRWQTPRTQALLDAVYASL